MHAKNKAGDEFPLFRQSVAKWVEAYYDPPDRISFLFESFQKFNSVAFEPRAHKLTK